MSKHDFRIRYIFAVSPRQIILSVSLATVSGCAAAAFATVPGISEAAETAKVVGGMTAQELLALVAVAALGLTFYCIRTMVQQNKDATVALTQIADRMRLMKCVHEAE
jgi:hypothetical protein